MSTEAATTTTTKKRVRKPAAKKAAPKKAAAPKAKAKKAAKPAKEPKAKKATSLPEDMKLAADAVKTVKGNRYINVEFANGYVLRLFPVGFKPAEVAKVSARLTEWLAKKLS